MLLWFLGLSFLLVLVVFDSPMLDYRLVMLGSVLPWLDQLWGPPWVMHSVFSPVAAMTVVMVAGWGRRLVQRRWLGVAIGLFLHLVLGGTFTSGELFWWPARGVDVGSIDPPTPGIALAVVLEFVGAAALVFLYRCLGLDDADRRSRFIRTGHVDRAHLRA